MSKNKQAKAMIQTFADPTLWCQSYLRNPKNREEPLNLRSYQREITDNTRKYKNIVLRWGRRLGKSVVMCADCLWWTQAWPLVQVFEGTAKKQMPFKVLIFTPYESQIKELWLTFTQLIGDSPLLKNEIEKTRASDVHEIIFKNESVIQGYTVGISSSNKGTSLRGLCLDGNTKVTMCDGTLKNIKNICIGDQVISYNNISNKFDIDSIIAVADPTKKQLYKIITSSGKTIKASEDHKFYTDLGYVRLKNLKIGDKLMTIDSDIFEEIISIKKDKYKISYDITTARYHNFIANGLVTHNSGDLLYIDEMDFIPEEIIHNVITPITTTHIDTKQRICSTPSGRREEYFRLCFPKKTPISTINGQVNIEDIKIGDQVFTENGNIDLVSHIFKHNYEGNFYKFKTKLSNIVCTEEHPIKTTCKIGIKPSFKEAKNIIKGHYMVYPIKKYPEIEIEYDPNIFKNNIKLEENINIINNNQINIKLLCRLLGYYLAEGNLLKSKMTTSYGKKYFYSGLQFTFNSKEITYINEVIDLIKTLFPNTNISLCYPKKSTTIIKAYNIDLSYLFKILVGEYSHKKFIHPFFLSKKENIEILKTFINGDGWCINENKENKFEANQFGLVTTSKELANSLLDICLQNKISVTKYIRNRDNKKTTYSIIKLKNAYKFDDNNCYIRIKKVEKFIDSKTVYNFETKNTHQYIADNILVHNCTRAEELGWLHTHHPSWHPDNDNWLSIEEAKKRNIPITESSEFQVRSRTPADVFNREYGAEFGEESGGVYKHTYLNSSLVKYGRNINIEDSDIFDPGFEQNELHKYIIGVDWNTYVNGGQVVLVEFCTTRTIEKYYDDENEEEVEIDFTGKYRLFYRRGIKAKNATQRMTRLEIIRLLKYFKIDYVYVDYGAGDTNIEELTLYGTHHPELELNKKLRVIDSGATVEHYDHVLQKHVKKRNKSLMINFSVLNLEEGLMLLPKEEDQGTRLVGQMRGYRVKNITTRGEPSYEGEDHILDGFNLALYGFEQNFGSLLKLNTVFNIATCADPKTSIYPSRQQDFNIVTKVQRNRDPEYSKKEIIKRVWQPQIGSRSNFNPGPNNISSLGSFIRRRGSF